MLFQLKILSVLSVIVTTVLISLIWHQFLTLLTVNLILYTQSRWLFGQVSWKSKWWGVWVGNWCLLCWSFPRGNLGRPFHLYFLVRILSWGSCALLKTTLMELTLREHFPWFGSSHAGHGSGGCWMLWMGNHNIYHTPGLACSAQSISDWPQSLHFDPPFCTNGSRLCCQSGEGHLGHVYPPVPWS